MFAHYFASRTRRYLVISWSPSLGEGVQPNREEIEVSGKREARAIAAARGLKCWNF